MTFLETLKNWIRKPAVPLVSYPLDPAKTNATLNPTPLQANLHYVRVRLARMYLKYQATWFQEWFPTVQSHVGFQFGNTTQNIPNVADAKRINLGATANGALVVAKSIPLTPTVPFQGGLIEISASLLAIKGANGLNEFIGVLGGFAEVLHVPQLSAVLAVAQPLADGLQVLLKNSCDHLHLGYFDSFSAGQLRDGYIVVMRSPAATLDRERLFVVDNELCEGDSLAPGRHQPFTGCDYMLLRTEVFEQRDDWENLTFISEPWQETQRVVSEQGPDWEKLADARLRVTLLKVNQAQELTRAHRSVICEELIAEYKRLKKQYSEFGAVAAAVSTFAQIAARAGSVEDALKQRELTDDEWLARI